MSGNIPNSSGQALKDGLATIKAQAVRLVWGLERLKTEKPDLVVAFHKFFDERKIEDYTRGRYAGLRAVAHAQGELSVGLVLLSNLLGYQNVSTFLDVYHAQQPREEARRQEMGR